MQRQITMASMEDIVQTGTYVFGMTMTVRGVDDDVRQRHDEDSDVRGSRAKDEDALW